MFRINRIEYKIVEPGSAEQKPSLGSNSGAGQHTPLVTCVMVTRGVISILRHSAECFRRQTYPHRELLVICNQNEENVESFFHSSDYKDVKIVRAPASLPLGNLRNIGISCAYGEMIAQWDDDDLSHPDRLSHCVNVLLSSGNAAAAFLSRCLIWWPARKLIFISQERFWEASMSGWRRAIPIYPGLSKSEDLHVVRNLHRYHPLALIEQPSLYVYTVTGRNTWDDDHFLWFLGRAKTVYRDEDYTQVLKHLQAHVPIHEYDEDIQRLAEGVATQD